MIERFVRWYWGQEKALYTVKLDRESVLQYSILIASIVATAFLGAVGILLQLGTPPEAFAHQRALDVAGLAVLTATGPYGFYVAARMRRVRLIEDRLPDFLQELASSHKAGLTLPKAVAIAASGDYGALTPEIRRMKVQLDWNVAFREVLDLFAERVKTPLVTRTVALINAASLLGRNASDVLAIAARDAREAKNLQHQRRTSMTLYTAVVYLAFFVFLVVVAVLYGTLVQQLVAVGQADAGLPGVGFFGGGASLAAYREFYFTAALVQAVGNGIVAGVIENGRWQSGLRHAFVMSFAAVAAFALLLP